MPFPRPTLTTLRTQAMQDITASDLPNADGFLRRSALRVLAWVQAGLAHLHYGFLDWIARQAVPYTATDEFLEAWAALAPSPVIRKAPTFATCSDATFAAVAGSVVDAGTLMFRGDNVQYQTVGPATAVGATITLAIVALVAGSDGNADQGTPLTLSTVVPGVTSNSGVANAAITGGADLETDQALRSRMLESYANPPAGGDQADYVTWALDVPGVTRAWCNPNGAGAGTVVVYTMWDVANASFNGFPQGSDGVATDETRDVIAQGDQLTVANYIYPLRPATALVYSCAPVALPQPFTLTGLSSTSSAQRASIVAALADLLVRKGSPLADTGIEQSDVDATIGAIAGLPAFAVSVPLSWPITPPVGSLFMLGTVVYA